MADTNVRIKLSADGKQVRDTLKLIDQDIQQLGSGNAVNTSDTSNTGNNNTQQGQSSSDRVKQSNRDRNTTLLLRELILVRRELQQMNRNTSSTGAPSSSNAPTPVGGSGSNTPTPPTPSGGGSQNNPPTPPGGNPPPQGLGQLQSVLGKLAAGVAALSAFNGMANSSQNRLSLAYKTYGSTLAYDDYNRAGKDAVKLGERYGYDYEVTMGASSANMRSGAGFKDIASYKADMNAILKSSKAWGLDPNAVASASGNMVGMGAFKQGEQQKFANLLAQSIVENGMQGMEDKQLDVLEDIAGNLSATNATVSQQSIESGLNLYNAIVGVNDSMKGQRGGNLTNKMMGLASGQDNALNLFAGLGTEYTGIEGYNEFMKKAAEDSTFVPRRAWDRMKEVYGEEKAAEYMKYHLQKSGGYSIGEAETVVESLKAGTKFDTKGTKTGEQAEQQRIENYEQDKVSDLEKSDIAIREAKDDVGDLINEIKAPILSVFNDMSDGAKMATIGATTIGGSVVFGKAAQAVWNRLGGAAAGAAEGAGGAAGGAAGASEALAGAARTGSKLVKKGAPIVAGVVGAYDTYEAIQRDDYRGAAEAAGGTLGGIGGAVAGAEAGAAIGALFGGVGAIPGAAIGGILGGIGGGFLGDSLGEWGGGSLYDLIAGDSEEHGESGVAAEEKNKNLKENTEALRENTKRLSGKGNNANARPDDFGPLEEQRKKNKEREEEQKSTSFLQWLFGSNGEKGKKHAVGNDYIPYDNYPALLHKGEKVLTKKESEEYDDMVISAKSSMPLYYEYKVNTAKANKAEQLAVGKDYVPYDNYPALLHKGEKVLTQPEADELGNLKGIDIPDEHKITENDSEETKNAKLQEQQKLLEQLNTSNTELNKEQELQADKTASPYKKKGLDLLSILNFGIGMLGGSQIKNNGLFNIGLQHIGLPGFSGEHMEGMDELYSKMTGIPIVGNNNPLEAIFSEKDNPLGDIFGGKDNPLSGIFGGKDNHLSGIFGGKDNPLGDIFIGNDNPLSILLGGGDNSGGILGKNQDFSKIFKIGQGGGGCFGQDKDNPLSILFGGLNKNNQDFSKIFKIGQGGGGCFGTGRMDLPLPEIPKADDTDQRLSKVIVPPDVASKNAEQGNSPGGAGTPATYNNIGSNMGSGGNMQITINVNGKIEGMTPDNQSQIVAAVIAQVNQTNFRQQISNGFIRTPNR